MARNKDLEKPDINPRNAIYYQQKISALDHLRTQKYDDLKCCRDNKKWFEIMGEINSISVDINNLKKQYAYRNSPAEYIPDQFVIIK